MATIHFILQGKGGVGKSMIASMMYQYYDEAGYPVIGYDTDPVNQTLSAFKEFRNIKQIDIMQDDGDNIDSRKFDLLLEELAEAPADTHVIIDNGASSFIALGAYMADSDMLSILADNGHQVFLHTVITGGQALLDTLNGFNKLVSSFGSSATIVVWKNPYFGKLAIDNKEFDDFKLIKENQDKIYATIEIPLGNKDLIGKDLELLFAKKQSFQAGINGTNPIAVKSRLKKYWKEMKERIDSVNLF